MTDVCMAEAKDTVKQVSIQEKSKKYQKGRGTIEPDVGFDPRSRFEGREESITCACGAREACPLDRHPDPGYSPGD